MHICGPVIGLLCIFAARCEIECLHFLLIRTSQHSNLYHFNLQLLTIKSNTLKGNSSRQKLKRSEFHRFPRRNDTKD